MTSIALPPPGSGVPENPDSSPLDRLRTLATDLAASSRAPATRRAYRGACGAFERWATATGVAFLPASGEGVAIYLAHLASEGRRASTIARALVAISQDHVDHGHPSPRLDPFVRRVIKGIRRRAGAEQVPKDAISLTDLSKMVAACGSDLRGLRDRAVLTLGFATGLRRSELVALDVADLDFVEAGVVVVVRRSKGDQEGLGRRVGASLGPDPESCPVRVLERWLAAGGITEGPIFRPVTRGWRVLPRRASARAVERVVKRAAAGAGLDPTRLSAHSLRSGCATALAEAGADERTIMRKLGHNTRAATSRYVRTVRLF